MARGTKNLMLSDKETLVELIDELQMKLKKKNGELHQVRAKLNQARTRVMKMKDIVEFQRKRIIELY